MIAAQRRLHDLHLLESLGLLGRKLELLGRGANGEDTRLRGVDDGREVVDAVHAQVGDGEGSALVLLGLELAVAGLGGERLGLGRDGREALGADVFDDGGDEAVGGGDGDADVRALVPEMSTLRGQRVNKLNDSLSDRVTQPSSVGLRDLGERERSGLDDCA